MTNFEDFIPISGPAVNTVEMREAEGLTDDNDYHRYPLCGDKPMYSWHTCYCGNWTLSGYADLQDGDYYCCVPPSADGQDQCTGGRFCSNNITLINPVLMWDARMARWGIKLNPVTRTAGTPTNKVRDFTRLPQCTVTRKITAFHWTRCVQESAVKRLNCVIQTTWDALDMDMTMNMVTQTSLLIPNLARLSQDKQNSISRSDE